MSQFPPPTDRPLAADMALALADLPSLDGRADLDRATVAAHPDWLIPALADLGPLTGVTASGGGAARIAKTGLYRNFQSGPHASMVLDPQIDLRLFAAHWAHARAVVSAAGRRSLHVFDAAGAPLHAILATEATDPAAWDALVSALACTAEPGPLAQAPAPESARANPARLAELRQGWSEMTDTHQFLRLVSRLKMNRLGAYRIAGEPLARALSPDAVPRVLGAAAAGGVPVMAFVGNRGCIEIHGGPLPAPHFESDLLKMRAPDLRLDLDCARVAEVWAATKPTKAGPAVSLEAFEADGTLIAQIFGMRRAGEAAISAWDALIAAEPSLAAPRRPDGKEAAE